MRKLFFLGSICFFCFLSRIPLFTQQYFVHQYNEIQGLMTSVVNDAAQDRLGQIWFATRRGISTFDGVNWINYTDFGNRYEVPFTKIAIGRDGKPWGLSWTGGSGFNLFCMEDSEWCEVPTPRWPGGIGSIPPSCLLIWETKSDRRVVVGTADGLYIRRGNQWVLIDETLGLAHSRVFGAVPFNGGLYVATKRGISIIGEDLNVFAPSASLGFPAGAVRGIGVEKADPHSLQKGHLWVYVSGRLGRLSPNADKLELFNLPRLFPVTDTEVTVCPDEMGCVILASRNRIFCYNYLEDLLEEFGVKSGLIGDGANSVFVDFEKNLWFTCNRGVSKIANRCFGTFRLNHGLLEDEVTAIVEYRPGHYLFGHSNGVTFYDGNQFHPVHFRPSASNKRLLSRVMDMKLDVSGNIWLTVAQRGIARIDGRKKIHWYGEERYHENFSLCLFPRPDGSVWIGHKKGVDVWRDGKIKKLPLASDIDFEVRRIFLGSDDSIYLGSWNNGVWKYKDGRWTNYRSPDNYKVNTVYSILEDRQGRILVGTIGGLYRLDRGGLVNYFSGSFSMNRPVFFIVENSDGSLWLGTDNGVIHWHDNIMRKYTIRDGLAGMETNRSACIIDSRAIPWFGTNRGVSYYRRHFDESFRDSVPPKASLRRITTPLREVSLMDSPGSVALESSENSLSFHFLGISFEDEKMTRFRYKLQGFDSDWQNGEGAIRKVTYNSLPPGTYYFQLMIRNAHGIWSHAVKSPKLTISGPFYFSWWFYTFFLVFVVGIFFLVRRYYTMIIYSSVLEKDVKERTRQLKDAEEQYFKLFHDSRDAIFVMTTGGDFIDVNPAGLELFGYSTKNSIMKKNFFFQHCVEEGQDVLLLQVVQKNGYVTDYEIFLKKFDGEPITGLLSATGVKDSSGKYVFLQGNIRDITEKKKLVSQMEQVRKMKAVGTLAGGVAHDLNNILSGLVNYPELMLLKIPEKSPLRKPLEAIKKTGEKAAAMVQDLLALSSSGNSVAHDVIGLNDVVNDYKGSVEFEKLNKLHPHVNFQFNLEDGLSNIMGSGIHLFKIVMNLVANSAEAMPEAGRCMVSTYEVNLEHSLLAYEFIEPGDYVVLQVSDDGVGIPPHYIDKIFEPFYTKKIEGKKKGTGLGMSVVWATVKDHNGYIDVISEQNRGTSFALYFPSTHVNPEIIDCRQYSSLQNIRGEERVLVVDDIKEQREIARSILSSLGYDVFLASSGEETIEFLAKDSVDLILLDMIMEPGLDGLATYQEICKVAPNQKVIIVSGFASNQKMSSAKALGIRNFIQKPYSMKDLGTVVRMELDREFINPQSIEGAPSDRDFAG
jgi:PAS domain S-box-containing protein